MSIIEHGYGANMLPLKMLHCKKIYPNVGNMPNTFEGKPPTPQLPFLRSWSRPWIKIEISRMYKELKKLFIIPLNNCFPFYIDILPVPPNIFSIFFRFFTTTSGPRHFHFMLHNADFRCQRLTRTLVLCVSHIKLPINRFNLKSAWLLLFACEASVITACSCLPSHNGLADYQPDYCEATS